jgi:hypothetical protein
MLAAWRSRSSLSQQLEELHIPDVQSATEADYIRLVHRSQCWWELLRLFKARRLPFGFRLRIPKEFGSTEAADNVAGETLPVS